MPNVDAEFIHQGPYRLRGAAVCLLEWVARNVTGFLEKKLDSLRAYRSQFFNPGYEGAETYIASERFWRTIEARARLAGALINVEFGEAFASDTPLPVDDLAGFLTGR